MTKNGYLARKKNNDKKKPIKSKFLTLFLNICSIKFPKKLLT